MSTVICYKQKEPTYYNKGTKWESSCDHFLSHYTYKSVEEAQKEVDYYNTEHPAKTELGHDIDWDNIAYFYVSEQEEMY